MTRSIEYETYIKSKEWHDRADKVKQKRGYKCERCGSTKQIDAHHKNYDRLGYERDSDIEIVCRACHARADKERAEHSAKRNYQNRLDAWASKVYGLDWKRKYTYTSMMACFNFYLEEHGKSEWIAM